MNNNQEIKFEIFRPININEIFTIPEDRSLWNDEPRYLRTNGGHRPNRDRYLDTSKLLIPQNEHIKDFFGGNSPTNYGIYILIFNDFKKFYVGIAARYSYMKGEERVEIQTPEGFLTRLRKHRAKCTGTFANINHTNQAPYGWRDFALDRNKLYCAKNVIDTMSDCLLSLVVFNNHENYKIDDKGILEKLEHHISESGISEYFGEEFKDYESFAHTRPQGLDFVPVFKHRDFIFRDSFTNEIQGLDNDLAQNRQNKATKTSNVNDVSTVTEEVLCDGETIMSNKERFLGRLDSNALDSWKCFERELGWPETYVTFTLSNKADCRFWFETKPHPRVLGRVFWQPRKQRFCFHLLAEHSSINKSGILNSEPHKDGPQKSRFYLNTEEMKDQNVIKEVSNALELGIKKLKKSRDLSAS